MKYIHFSILDKTLCGAEDEPVTEQSANIRRFCDECVNVMWREQYKRRLLNSPTNKIGEKVVVEEKEVEEKLDIISRPIKTLRYYLKVKI